MGVYIAEDFTDEEQDILRRYFTNLDGPVFALVNLPEVVKGALFARYSRSPKSLRRLFLDEFVGDLDITGDQTVDATVQVGHYPGPIAVSPDGRRVYVANTVADTLSVINTADHQVLITLAVGHRPVNLAVSADSRWVYVTNEKAGTVAVIDTAQQSVVSTVAVGDRPEMVVVKP